MVGGSITSPGVQHPAAVSPDTPTSLGGHGTASSSPSNHKRMRSNKVAPLVMPPALHGHSRAGSRRALLSTPGPEAIQPVSRAAIHKRLFSKSILEPPPQALLFFEPHVEDEPDSAQSSNSANRQVRTGSPGFQGKTGSSSPLRRLYVEAQTTADISKQFRENDLGGLVAGFMQTPRTLEQRNVAGAGPWDTFTSTECDVLQAIQDKIRACAAVLTKQDTLSVTQEDIRTLLEHTDPAARATGRQLLATLIRACKYPRLLVAALAKSDVDPLRIEPASHAQPHLVPTQIQVSVSQWVRSRAVYLYFQTQLMRDLVEACKPHLPHGMSIRKFIAIVGFNRLMSDTNLQGASLSSDVDFKLIVDTVRLAEKIAAESNVKVLDDIAQNKLLIMIINQTMAAMAVALKRTATYFENELGLSLDVDQHSIQTLREIANITGSDDPAFAAEKNFLATIAFNHNIIAGDARIGPQFRDCLQTQLKHALAQRCWQQFVADSSKGSLFTIQSLHQFELTLSRAGTLLASDDKAQELTRNYVKKWLPQFRLRDANKLLFDARGLSRLLTYESFAARFATLALAHDVFEGVTMFRTMPTVARMQTLCKLLKTFDDPVYQHHFIGRKDLTPTASWVYSIKYAGLRTAKVFLDSNRRL